jgi:hypothetical protein
MCAIGDNCKVRCVTLRLFRQYIFLKARQKTTIVIWIYLWSSGHSSWLQIQRSGFDSRRYQTFWEVIGLERGPLSLLSTIEELLGRHNRGSSLENREYCRRDPPRWPRDTLSPQKLALTSPTRGGRSVGVVRSRTKGHGVVIISY